MLSLNNSTRVTFKRRPRYGGTIAADQFVELIAEAIVVGTSWTTTLQMLPCNDQAMWQLGNAINGILGQTTVLGY